MVPASDMVETTSAAGALKAKRQELFSRINQIQARDFLYEHAAAVDEYCHSSFAQSAVGPHMDFRENPYALIALGGYARFEQCVHSDIDLLFLFENKVPRNAKVLVQEILYPLWDLGLEAAHATRTINDCLNLARQDLEILVSLLDCRFVCGMSPLYHKLIQTLRDKLIRIKPARIIDQIVESNMARHERFGNSAYLLEPNLTEGQGGLRDYHSMLWIAQIQSGVKSSRDLEYYGYVSHDVFQTLEASLGFVWNVRNHLHLLMGRKCDQLHLGHQVRLAETMDIQGVGRHLRVERLLGNLHGRMEFIKQCYDLFFYELDLRKRHRKKMETDITGLKFENGMLNFVSSDAVLNNPMLLIQVFVESTVRKVPLSVRTCRLIKQHNEVVRQSDFRRNPKVVAAFEKVLFRATTEFSTLNTMLTTGFLENFIPQFRDVVDRIQFDQYHLYPVDRHLLLSVQLLQEVGKAKGGLGDKLSRRIYADIRKKRVLLWAVLLHDLGKAEPTGGHSERGAMMAVEICKEKGLTRNDVDTVAFLIRHHLLLFEVATRKDINDDETALNVARKVEKTERLKMLYLLSVVDAMATGPKAWNDWTASVLSQLYLKVLNILDA